MLPFNNVPLFLWKKKKYKYHLEWFANQGQKHATQDFLQNYGDLNK